MTPVHASINTATAQHWLQALDRQPGGSLKLVDALDLHEVLQVLQPLRPMIQGALGAEPWCIADQCWVRRAQPPHSWHQDGALHHDFANQPPDVASMLTCWIALTPCGNDAPGLEWVEAPLTQLLPPAELTDGAVKARFAAAAFKRPILAAGDALIFSGGLLHRTHSTPAMTQRRTSMELRFCANPPPSRLAAEPLRTWRQGGATGRAAPVASKSSTKLPPG